MAALDDFREHRSGLLDVASRGDDAEAALARQAYVTILPRIPLSRSPISGAVFSPPIDTVDLDGPWWDAREPARPDERHPEEVVSFSGALRLSASRVRSVPFLAVPGPEVPFVHPQLLGAEGVVAVVSQIAIGPHVGMPIVYFAPPGTEVPHRLNEWGSNSYRYAGAEGEDFAYEGDWDFDLEPWLSAGKLQWIAPDDTGLVLRTGADGCPYLGMAGARGVARIQDGEVWRPPDPPA